MAETAEMQMVETYTLVDDIQEVSIARHHQKLQAEQLLESRRQEYDKDPSTYLPVDALSTALEVVNAGLTSGEHSDLYKERYKGLVLDCQRLVGEWYRKNKPEYFAPVRHVFDKDTEDFYSHGLSIRQMTDNALTPMADNPEDEARRINERVEESTPHLLRKLGHIAIGKEAIRTISECTDKAIDDYSFDKANGNKHRGYNGYVPEIEKVMIRDITLKKDSMDRYEEQVGIPGIYITHEIIQKALAQKGVEAENMGKTELHGSQMVVKDSLMEFVELLDTVASEEWCTNVFMGEEVPKGFEKNYSTFKQEALIRQKSLKDLSLTTANFVLSLAEEGFDRRKAPGHVEEFVKKLLLDVAKQDVVIAEQMFDKTTAVGLQKVAYLESIGQLDQANQMMQQVEKTAPGGGFCGAGSCGLESVDINSKSGKDLMKKLNADNKDTLVKDKERACKCGSKSIVYAYNKTKVNKYCEGCGSFESKITKPKG